MILSLPLSVTIPRKTKEDKVFTLNLNTFRNAHHFIMNAAKRAWLDVVADALGYQTKMPDPPYLLTYTVFPASQRKFDLGNVLPAVQKFTDDALIELGWLKDDDYKHIRAIDYRFGRVDKENPRIELEISHWEET
jgi:hypothetical protein